MEGADEPPMTATEVGEDVPDEGQPTLEEALAQLGLTNLTEVFQKEQIDFDSLVSVKYCAVLCTVLPCTAHISCL